MGFVQGRPAANLSDMGLMKKLVKLLVIIAVLAAVAGIATMLKAKRAERDVTIDEWPDVPRNPSV